VDCASNGECINRRTNFLTEVLLKTRVIWNVVLYNILLIFLRILKTSSSTHSISTVVIISHSTMRDKEVDLSAREYLFPDIDYSI
jgi:hypothetical protein